MMFPSGYLKTVYGLIEPEADYNLLSEDQKEGLGQAIEQALNEKEKCCVAMLSENISPKLIAEEIGVSGPRYYAIKKNIKKKLGQYEYRKTYEYGAEGWLVERNRCREAIKEAVRTGDTRDAFLLRADWVFDIDFNTMKHIYTSVCQYRDDGRDYMKYVTDPAVTVDDLVSYKGKTAMIPFEDRIEIVRSIRYVDAAVPQYDMDKLTACKKLGAKILFVGDDWYSSPKWQDYEQEFSQEGIRIVYFPYTRGVSSTKIGQALQHIRGWTKEDINNADD